ncbi:class I glutamine amidotransferase-like protein [Scheffersomyces coipomensis]|uniref:class I glutamine amidotransferase-like protein n=1 Tax=Scheffersomyces coipomensis TaxID=1788519 RepID=UPI00315D94C0
MTIDYNINHIAILVCDTPIENVTEVFGDFGDNTHDLLKNGQSNLPYPVIKYQVCIEDNKNSKEITQLKQAYDQLRSGIVVGHIKGIILTGSRADSFAENILWITLLDDFITSVLLDLQNFPIVGICFGHQILAKNLNCKVGRNLPEKGWECGTTVIQLNKDIYTIENSPFKNPLKIADGSYLDELNLVEFHRDIVYGIPPPSSSAKFITIGSTSKCSIQGLITESGPLKVLTFQGHPEFTTPIAKELLKSDLKNNCFSEEDFEEFYHSTENLDNQGQLFGDVINEFLNIHCDTQQE